MPFTFSVNIYAEQSGHCWTYDQVPACYSVYVQHFGFVWNKRLNKRSDSSIYISNEAKCCTLRLPTLHPKPDILYTNEPIAQYSCTGVLLIQLHTGLLGDHKGIYHGIFTVFISVSSCRPLSWAILISHTWESPMLLIILALVFVQLQMLQSFHFSCFLAAWYFSMVKSASNITSSQTGCTVHQIPHCSMQLYRYTVDSVTHWFVGESQSDIS